MAKRQRARSTGALLSAQHRLHLASASMSGRSSDTIRTAREFAETASPGCSARCRTWRPRRPRPVRAGAVRPVGGDPAPASAARRFPYVTGSWRYARGLAFAATGRRPTPRASWPRCDRSPRRARRADARVLLQDAGDPHPRGECARRGDRRAVGPDGPRRPPLPGRRGGAGRPLVHRAAGLVLPGPAIPGRGPPSRRAAGRGGGRLS